MWHMTNHLSDSGLTRRQMLRSLAAAGVATTGSALGALGTEPASNLVAEENKRPGTRDWMLRKTHIDPESRYRSPSIEGYCSQRSVRSGEMISFHVSTNPASAFTLDIYRSGYYGGAGGRLVQELGPFEGNVQPQPPVGPKRVRICQWDTCAELQIPDNWLS